MADSAVPRFENARTRELEAQLALTRQELALTVDELAEKVDPRVQARRAADQGRKLVSDLTDPDASDDERKRAYIAVAVAAGVVLLVVTGVVRAFRR
jgi:hypothetical protein